MTVETTGGAVPASAPATSELQPEASAPPADGVVADPDAQPADPNAAPATPASETPEHRTAKYRFAEQQRIHEAQLKAARLEGENEALRKIVGGQGQPAATPTPPPPAGPVAPDPTDRSRYPLGDIDPAYIDDKIAYGVEVTLEKRQKREVEQSAETEQLTRTRSFVDSLNAEGLEAAKEFVHGIPSQHTDFLYDLSDLSNPALMSRYFADPRNKQQTLEIVQLPRAQRRLVMGEIMGVLNARSSSTSPPAPPAPPAPVPAGAPVTTTPAVTPTPALSGGGGAAPIGSPPQGDIVAYKAWRARAYPNG